MDMPLNLEHKLDITLPMTQATRCLDIWLKQENLTLEKDQHKKASVLLARYFLYEDNRSDALMLSFLRHYSLKQEQELDDPKAVRLALKNILGQCKKRPYHTFAPILMRSSLWVTALTLFIGILWIQQDISYTQIQHLRTLVREITSRDQNAHANHIWRTIKAPLGVQRYEDMTQLGYYRSRLTLESRIADLQNQSAGTGM